MWHKLLVEVRTGTVAAYQLQLLMANPCLKIHSLSVVLRERVCSFGYGLPSRNILADPIISHD